MAKKNIKTGPKVPQITKKTTETIPDDTPARGLNFPAWLSDFKIQAIIVGILALGLFANTFKHEYALDDTIVIVKNEYVYEGFAGIPSILTKDAFDSYYKQFNSSNQLSGGRYRPLSIVSFAIEQQFLGPHPVAGIDTVVAHGGERGHGEKKLLHDMAVRHVVNVLLFTLSMIVFLYFLRYVVFKNNPVMALLTAILFVIHPIHTEVVANVKSRDEIMSLLFICLTFIYAFKYEEQKEKWQLGIALVCYFLAFLSKEYAIALIILLPLSFYLFNRETLMKSIMMSLPYYGVMAVYIIIRLQIVAPMSEDSNSDILNNPYALATNSEKLATQISTTLSYLRLLIFPHPLSADYSYNTIPYKDITNPLVWLSLGIHIWLFRMMFYYFKKRSVMCFAIAFYLMNLLLICNIIFNIGGTMGERLIYHSSVGFCMAVAYLLYKGMERIKSESAGRLALAGVMTLLIVGFGFRTIARNANWKNDQTLFFHDIENAPNSVLVNADVAASYINMADGEPNEEGKRSDLHKGVHYYNRAIEIDNAFVSGYVNRGMAYFNLREPDSALYNLEKVRQLYPRYPKLDEMFFNIGVNYYVNKRYPEAISVWQTTLKINPNYAQAQNALNVINNQMRAGR